MNSGLFWQLDSWKMWQELMERPDDPADDEGDHEGHPHAHTHHHQDGSPTGSQNTSWWEVYLQWQAMVNQILNPQSLRQYRFTLAKSEVIEAYNGRYAFGGHLAAGPALIITNPQAIDFADAAEHITVSGGKNLTIAPNDHDHILTP